MNEPLLKLSGISKAYAETEASAAAEVLKKVELEIAAGETVAIIGTSGSGKSTLLNIIGTLDRPDTGHVQLLGRDLASLTEEDLARVRSRDLGFIFQLHHLLPQLSVLENVLVPTLAGGPEKRSEKAEARAKRLLDRVGLSQRLTHRPGQLSGGERQRAAVVRALINEPRLLLADEPTGALDRASSERMADLLVELNREEQVSLIVVTHAQALARRMGRAYELVDGVLSPLETGP